ncbi:hypothetical protein [Methylorubrum aminovorans]|uniref:hypothetical protein n=1 Tax=Methylorubrum aminovorans TaxID=269069 RepID=UPI003C2EDF4B
MSEETRADDAREARNMRSAPLVNANPELRAALLSGRLNESWALSELAPLAQLTDEMLEAGLETFSSDRRFVSEREALTRAYVAMRLLASDSEPELISAANKLWQAPTLTK